LLIDCPRKLHKDAPNPALIRSQAASLAFGLSTQFLLDQEVRNTIHLNLKASPDLRTSDLKMSSGLGLMMARPTVHDIAREAGVSLATVDRVLNARPRVRESSVKRVQGAVEKLGYVRDVSAANLAKRKEYRFAFVIPDSSSQFVETIRAALNEAKQSPGPDRISIEIIIAPVDDANATARILSGLEAAQFNGVAVMCPETPQVRDAVMRLKQAGLAVVALVSDLPSSGRDHFVGVDNVAAGRTAGALMGRFLGGKPGKVLVVSGSLSSRDSIERRFGFDGILAERFPSLEILPTIESRDDIHRLIAIVKQVMAVHRDVIGVYALVSGNAAILDALRATGRIGSCTVIMHELTPVTRAALEAEEVDAVIMQNVGHLIRSSIRVLRAYSDKSAIVDSQEQIRIEIVMRENLVEV
jgi:LacI family transcriptional regulator